MRAGADNFHRRYSGLHFVNAVNDTPPFLCDFGSKGWLSKENILQGIVDTTRQVLSSDRYRDSFFAVVLR